MIQGPNDDQRLIAKTFEGAMVVDAGPGTGKTFTIVQRYLNMMAAEIRPSDILLLTFTNNAAEEMRDRIIHGMTDKTGSDMLSIQTSTFSAFCYQIVRRSPESINRFLKVRERLSRSWRLVQNETLNMRFFRQVYEGTIGSGGVERYGRAPATIGNDILDLYRAMLKLMTLGIIPMREGWFGDGEAILLGDTALVKQRARGLNIKGEKGRSPLLSALKGVMDNKELPDLGLDADAQMLPDHLIEEAAEEDRSDLLLLMHDVYLNFIRRSLASNRLTFGLLELFAFMILYADRNVRREMGFRYMMIDEFQDTNELQFMISLMLLKEPNLCAVGDWKQGIYGFRHASIENITEFYDRMGTLIRFLNRDLVRVPFDAPEVLSIPLRVNYRSHESIIDASFRALYSPGSSNEEPDRDWLDENVVHLEAGNSIACGHGHVEYLRAEDREAQYSMVLERALDYLRDPSIRIQDGNGYRQARLGDMAVLVRRGASARALRDLADESGIPVRLQGDMEIMSLPEGKLLLAWLRFLNDPRDRRGLITLLEREGCAPLLIKGALKGEDCAAMDRLHAQRKVLLTKKRRVTALITSVFRYHGIDNEVSQAIVSTVSSIHRESLLTIPELVGLLENDIRRETAYPVQQPIEEDAITIQTMHSSKGLEYPIVIAACVDSAVMPISQSEPGAVRFHKDLGLRCTRDYHIEGDRHVVLHNWRWPIISATVEKEYDEERRLFFVALSRARQYLTVTCHKPSPFMEHVSQGLIQDWEGSSFPGPFSRERSKPMGRPALDAVPHRRSVVSVHSIMGEAVAAGGKGKDHGIKVHRSAELMANGLPPEEALEENDRISAIIGSLDGAELLTEVECRLPLTDATLRGVADLVAMFPDRIEIHDFKTDGNRENEPLYRVQLSAYAHSASNLDRPVRCFIQYLSSQETVEITPLSLEELDSRAVEVLAAHNHI